MCAYIYETVQHDGENRIKLFTTAIDYSGFHWHYDYEFILVLKGQLNIINLRKKWKGICSQVPFIVLKYRQGCI